METSFSFGCSLNCEGKVEGKANRLGANDPAYHSLTELTGLFT